MKTLKQIVENYYKIEGCGCGGPLHILLDDDNYDMGSVSFCIDHCFDILNSETNYGTDYSDTVCLLGIMICNEYSKMSLEERATFDVYLCGQSMECFTGGNGCADCGVLGDLYDFMLEEEVNYDQT